MEEPTASWASWNFQLASWATMEPAAGPGWAPGLLPVETESADEIFGSGWLQTTVPSIEKAAQELFDDVNFHSMEMKWINHYNNPMRVFEEAAREFKVDIDMMKMKIHRYPPSIREFKQLEQWFTVPRLVAIGPYHHGQDQVKHAEKAKHVAAYHCITESGHSVQEMYDAVASAAHEARGLYDRDWMAAVSDGDFLPMMFCDACFLVQYMAWCMNDWRGGAAGDGETVAMDPSLRSFFDFNRKAIRHDIMLLENQIPWRVVAAVLLFGPVNVASFVAQWKDYLQDRKNLLQDKPFVLDDGYEPPHLLGLLRFYIVGRSSTKRATKPKIMNSISVSVSAIELAEIGIKLRANQATQTEIIHMGVNYRTGTATLFAELSLPPLSLDDERSSFLINMAVLELCSTSNFQEAEDEESAICSYLLLLAMLVDREEDVHELRTRRLLQGGGGLTNKDALQFQTGLQSLPLRGSSCYIRVMEEIEKYRINRRLQIMVHAFIYKHRTAIFTVFSVIGVLVSILGTLLSLKARSVLK